MKVILDANVIIAAFAARGLCKEIFEVCLNNNELFVCKKLFYEVEKNLIKKIKLPQKIIDDIISMISNHSTFAKPDQIDGNICRDKNDLYILGLALKTNADCIVTGDKDLLVLKQFKNTRILTPRNFSNIL